MKFSKLSEVPDQRKPTIDWLKWPKLGNILTWILGIAAPELGPWQLPLLLPKVKQNIRIATPGFASNSAPTPGNYFGRS